MNGQKPNWRALLLEEKVPKADEVEKRRGMDRRSSVIYIEEDTVTRRCKREMGTR
jgi:hypothetical protein